MGIKKNSPTEDLFANTLCKAVCALTEKVWGIFYRVIGFAQPPGRYASVNSRCENIEQQKSCLK